MPAVDDAVPEPLTLVVQGVRRVGVERDTLRFANIQSTRASTSPRGTSHGPCLAVPADRALPHTETEDHTVGEPAGDQPGRVVGLRAVEERDDFLTRLKCFAFGSSMR
jgi:hypothetical protein